MNTLAQDTMNTLAQENQILFSAAYGERKNMNIARFNEYMKKRVASFVERTRIYDILKTKLDEKQKYTKSFIRSVIKYFEDYVNLYQNLKKTLSKFDLGRKYKTQITYAGVRDSIEELLNLNAAELEHVEKFIDWI